MKKKNNQPSKQGDDKMMFRAAELIATGGEEESVRMSVSSETPVLSYIYFNREYQQCYEILDHSHGSVDLSRCVSGLVIQDRHYGDQVGLIRKPEVVGGKLCGEIEFCTGSRAQEMAQDAKKGLRTNCSVGYIVDTESYVLEGERDGIPVVRAMRWTPYEASFEPVPADVNVGVGRAAEVIGKPEKKERKEVITMDPKEIMQLYKRAAEFGIAPDEVGKMIENHETRSAELALSEAIIESQRKSVDELKQRKPDMPTQERKTPTIGGDVKTQEEVKRRYSLLSVLRRAAGITVDARGKKVDCGFEDEISQECRNMGMGSQRGGQFIVPHAVLAKRDFTVSGTSSATVATNLMVDEFIDLLRTKSVLGSLGVRFLTGLVGNIDIPKMTAGLTGYWVAEGGDITESQPTLGQVSGTPHTCGVMTDITRRMLIQSTPAAEQMVRNEMFERLARTLQIAYFQGTGADGQPSAITAAIGINNPAVTEGTPTYAELLGFPGSILSDSAQTDNQKWAMTGEVWQKLAATFIDSNSNAERVLDWRTKTVLGQPYEVTEDVGANSLFFGDFSTTMVGIWGAGIDLNLDTATLSSSGGLRIVGLQDVDIMVRLGQALAYNSAVTA